MKKQVFYWLALGIVVIMGCQKELSFEGSDAPSEGSLQADLSGDCLPKTVNGIYEATKVLVATSNTIIIQVNVTKTGSYAIGTDTVNGYYFRGVGTLTTLGPTNITLRGNGTPFIDGINNFVVSYDGTVCDIQITVVPAGTGGPAEFTINSAGSPASCSGATASGTYIIGSPLIPGTNQVTLNVTVTKLGIYTVSSTLTNGMTFSATGTFTALGPQPLVLSGNGTPSGTPGPVTIPITAGSSTCNFSVTTTAGATYAADCTSAIVNGTYTAGVALDGTNTVDIDINVTAIGPYNIVTTLTNGMTFSASGNFAATGPTPVTLQGSGTPGMSGTFPIPVPGSTTCTFDVIVAAAATIDWKFNIGATLYQGTTDLSTGVTFDNSTPPITFVDFPGTNASSDDFELIIIDLLGGVNNGETYSTSSMASNAGAFYFFDGATTVDLYADPGETGVSITITVTNHNVAAKTITGTFSGTANDYNGGPVPVVRTITNGTFTIRYP